MFDKRFYPHLWLLIIYIPFVFIVKEFLPQNAARENGPIENFQLVLLAVGIYLCWQAMKKTRVSMDKYIWQAGMLFYILVFGRELSWGRALLMQSDGTMPKMERVGDLGRYCSSTNWAIDSFIAVFILARQIFSVFENRKNTNVGFNIFSSIYSFS